MLTRHLPVLLTGALLLAPSFASAQQRDAQARSMVRQAMEDYQNLEVDPALNRLRLALNLCGQRGCTPAILARVHIAIGVVTIGGQNDASAGVDAFVEALRLDPSAEPDQLLVTPEITAALNQARQRVGGRGSATGPAPTPTGGNTGGSGFVQPTPTPLPSSGGVSGGLLHTPSPEQLENTPVPVYVEANTLQAARVVAHYRGLGMSGYSDLNLMRVANGWGGEIPCGQVIQPHVEYYVTAHDEAGTVIGSSGSAESPTRVPIVRTRSQPAPALPGRMPAETCVEDCPPGMSGPQCRRGGGGSGGRGQRQLGDPCESNNQCATGLHCEMGSCADGEAGGGGSSGSSDQYRFAIDIGGGVGLGYLSGDPRRVPQGGFNTRYAEGDYVLEDDQDPDSALILLPDAPCSAMNPMLKCPNITSPGFAPSPYFYVALRFNPFTSGMLSRLGFGASFRFQFDSSGTGALPNMFFGGRAYFAFTPNGWTRSGLVGAAFLGSGVGQMQARPGLARSQGETAHLVSGLNNVHAGARIEYGFGNIGHVGADVTMNFQMPNFMFVMDVQAVAGLHF